MGVQLITNKVVKRYDTNHPNYKPEPKPTKSPPSQPCNKPNLYYFNGKCYEHNPTGPTKKPDGNDRCTEEITRDC